MKQDSTMIRTGHESLKSRRWAVAFFAFLVLSITMPISANACSSPCDTELNQQQVNIFEDYDTNSASQIKTRDVVNANTDLRFVELRAWLLDTVFYQKLLPAWAMMTEQISASALHHMEVIGMFLDAKHQLESQRLFQKMSATAYKDYQPSEGICTIGTMTRSLGGTERNVDATALVLSKQSMDRQLRKINASSDQGGMADKLSRYKQFRERYCDRRDNGQNLSNVCEHSATVSLDALNKDVDFYRTVGKPTNLNIDFNDPVVTDDEVDVFALESNLYAHDIGDPISAALLKKEGVRNAYLTQRAIAAKRSVAQNSFQSIAAMKSSGQTSVALTGQYLQAALEEIGISADDAQALIGDNPSYYAQMDVLTKKIFQRPEFFVDLYDKPANVERKSVALQAISVMQRRDLFKSALRSEAMLSVLLELELGEVQDSVQNELDRLKQDQ